MVRQNYHKNESVIIVLDDIDRMSPDEVVFVLKLVKMISDFPQIIFVLPMDYNKVAEIVEKKFGSEVYKNYLQKIVQTVIKIESFDLEHLKAMFVWQVEKFFVNEMNFEKDGDWKTKMQQVFEVYLGKAQNTGDKFKAKIITPRDIKQLSNKIVEYIVSQISDDIEEQEIKKEIQTILDQTLKESFTISIDELIQTQVFLEE